MPSREFQGSDVEATLDRRDASAVQRIEAAAIPPGDGLAQLVRLRAVAVVGQAAAIGTCVALGVALPVASMALVVAALVVLNAITAWRLRRGGDANMVEVTLALALDLAAFTVLVVMSGGTANPFHMLFVLHAALIALLLPALPAIIGTALVLAGYAASVHLNQPLALVDGAPLSVDLVSLGSVLALVLTVVMTAWFVARLVAMLCAHQQLLQAAAEKAHRDEMIVRVGALAAGAAHELATPLTTIGLLAAELQQHQDPAAIRRDAAALQSQVDASRRTLENLSAAARHAHAGSRGVVAVDRFVERVAERQRKLRPGAGLTCRWDGPLPVPEIVDDVALEQTLLILLNNAADASVDNIDMAAQWDPRQLEIAVRDRGDGVPDSMREQLGRRFFTTKPPGKGTGLGLVLAANVARERGGSLRFSAREGGGTCAELLLPLVKLQLRRD